METETDTRPLQVQRWAKWVILASGLLAFAAAAGFSPIPHGSPAWAWWFHPLMFLLGAAGGVLTIQRSREIDAERWHIVHDGALTSGERAWAHKEAERQMRSAGTVFLLAGVTVGAWLAYQFRIPKTITAAELLIATPVLGFGLGLLIGNRKFPKIEPQL